MYYIVYFYDHTVTQLYDTKTINKRQNKIHLQNQNQDQNQNQNQNGFKEESG